MCVSRRRRARFSNWARTARLRATQRVLENGAFLSEKDNFYRSEVTQSEPIKGNFTSVARCRLSGMLLGPTNHHAYQPQLRGLYEQRFSRRMSFPDYQRQIEIVTDPEAVERWKEEARSVTTYVTLQEEPPLTFNSAAETERHFRQTYLPGLLRSKRGIDSRRGRQSPAAGSVVRPGDRGRLGAGISFAFENDAGVDRRFSAGDASSFPASQR